MRDEISKRSREGHDSRLTCVISEWLAFCRLSWAARLQNSLLPGRRCRRFTPCCLLKVEKGQEPKAGMAGAVKVHGVSRSTCTMRVLAALSEKNVDHELIFVNLMKGEHKQPPFLTLQPFGVIPVLQDGDLTLFESRAIARYVAEKYEEGTPLYGSSISERALIEQWVEVESQNYAPTVQPIFYQLIIHPMRGLPTDHAAVEAGLAKLEKILDIYEEQLGKSTYLAGDSFSLADLTHMPQTHYLMSQAKVAELYQARKNIVAWWDRISARPAWKKVVALSAP